MHFLFLSTLFIPRCTCARPDASWVAPRLRTPAACLAQLICRLVALCVGHGRWRLSGLGGRWRWLLALREPRQSSQRRAGLDCGPGRLRGAGRPRPRAKAGGEPEPEPGQEWWGRCWARPRPDERAAGRGAAVGVFPVPVPLAPWGHWNLREGASPTMRKFKIRKGLEGLTAGSSSAAQPPPSQPPAPAGSRQPAAVNQRSPRCCRGTLVALQEGIVDPMVPRLDSSLGVMSHFPRETFTAGCPVL
ncbi:uncharacterized protein LOC143659956 [Tamandua tetradactyla]|uniref:uncharacterized protein LOC143659956 n=1 Tax=Tamandua tetradactyla TaxID=48850 RepID=UPI0040541FD8